MKIISSKKGLLNREVSFYDRIIRKGTFVQIEKFEDDFGVEWILISSGIEAVLLDKPLSFQDNINDYIS